MSILSSSLIRRGRRAAAAMRRPKHDEIRTETLLQIAGNVVMRIGRDNLMLVAAGVAYYAMLAIFPAIAAFVSIYGLFADPNAVENEIAGYANLLPEASLKLLTDALAAFAHK